MTRSCTWLGETNEPVYRIGNDDLCAPCVHKAVYGTGNFDGSIDQFCSRLDYFLPDGFSITKKARLAA